MRSTPNTWKILCPTIPRTNPGPRHSSPHKPSPATPPLFQTPMQPPPLTQSLHHYHYANPQSTNTSHQAPLTPTRELPETMKDTRIAITTTNPPPHQPCQVTRYPGHPTHDPKPPTPNRKNVTTPNPLLPTHPPKLNHKMTPTPGPPPTARLSNPKAHPNYDQHTRSRLNDPKNLATKPQYICSDSLNFPS